MEQKLSDTLVKAIDRSNPMMQNLQLASRFNKLIDEGGGSADLEDDHATTIDVSAYTDPVEVTPAEGKDGMKKNTITLTNIPQSSVPLYAWGSNGTVRYYPFSVSPSTKSEFDASTFLDVYDNRAIKEEGFTVYSYTKISDTEFEVVFESGLSTVTYTRDSAKDLTLW